MRGNPNKTIGSGITVELAPNEEAKIEFDDQRTDY